MTKNDKNVLIAFGSLIAASVLFAGGYLAWDQRPSWLRLEKKDPLQVLCREWCDKCILSVDPESDCYETCDQQDSQSECSDLATQQLRCWLDKSCFESEVCSDETAAVRSCVTAKVTREIRGAPEPVPSDEVRAAVAFIRTNAERRTHATEACYAMENCTYFHPENGTLNLPRDAKRCLQERIPKCEAALDDLARNPPPPPIRSAYMKWAHESEVLRAQAAKLALEALEDYGRPPPIKKDGDGYADFWSSWVAKRYPAKNTAQLELMSQEIKVRGDGFQELEAWLTPRNVCWAGQKCFPNKVESGRVVENTFK